MCGRYNLTDSPIVHVMLEELGIDIGPLPTRYNVAPTEATATIIGGEQPGILDMRWWFTPAWSDGPSTQYSMFNAKSETIANSRAFRGAFKYRRGIVPVSSFIEWQTKGKAKQPYLISNQEGCLFLAAIWEVWNNELYSCAIVTTAASEAFAPLHKRQPVILSMNEALQWLRTDNGQNTAAMHPLMQSKDLSEYLYAPVDTTIGNSRIKTAPTQLAEFEALRNFH